MTRDLDTTLLRSPAFLGEHTAPTGAAPVASRRSERDSTFAVLLHLDEFSEHRVRQAWESLEEHGVRSAGSAYGAGYRPHITLAIAGTSDPAGLAARLRGPLAGVAGLPVTLTALGFFLTDKAPAYLSVAPTRRLLELHEEVHEAIGTADTWSYYRPGSWMPHCTLAMGVGCQTTVAEALGRWALPIEATVGSAVVTELPRTATAKSHRRTPGAHRREPAAPSRFGVWSARG